MKIIQYLTVFIIIALIIVHGFWPNLFKVDSLTILLIFILSIPIIAPYVKKLKFLGAEFEFKEGIRKTQESIKRSAEQVKKEKIAGKKRILPFETFNLSSARELIESDPVLALASLRIEIEKKLKSVTNFFDITEKDRKSISKLIEFLRKKEILFSGQISALREIVNMCNKAVHGYDISKKEAKEILNLAEKLNKTFSIGYSIDFAPNMDYKTHGLCCEWEHCIEWMPLTLKPTELSCPIFGHNCPGGIERKSNCGKTKSDIFIHHID